MKWSTNRKIMAVGIGVLLMAFVVSLTPWYDAYIAHDNRWTCAKLRKSIEWNYSGLLEENLTTYAPGSEELVQQAQKQTYRTIDVEIVPESSDDGYYHYVIRGLCRDGGTIHATVDDSGWIHVTCDLQDHDIDYTELPEY